MGQRHVVLTWGEQKATAHFVYSQHDCLRGWPHGEPPQFVSRFHLPTLLDVDQVMPRGHVPQKRLIPHQFLVDQPLEPGTHPRWASVVDVHSHSGQPGSLRVPPSPPVPWSAMFPACRVGPDPTTRRPNAVERKDGLRPGRGDHHRWRPSAGRW